MTSNSMNQGTCEETRRRLALLIYGELSFDEEEQVEVHLERCGDCRLSLERERELMAAIDQVSVEPSPGLLSQNRALLAARLAQEPAPGGGFWKQLVDMVTLRSPAGFPAHGSPSSGFGWAARPVGAIALLAIGFLGARVVPNLAPGIGGGFGAASLADLGPATVRSVERSEDGQVQIVLDETRQRVVSGHLDDDLIRGLLLDATTDPSNMVRAETVAILSTRAQAADVRDVLMYAIRNDDNDGVRLKAMDGLKAFTREGDVQQALAEVLLSDSNPGMRTQAIDLLMAGMSDSMEESLDREMVGVLQELMLREQDEYVRQRCQRALELMNASTEIF